MADYFFIKGGAGVTNQREVVANVEATYLPNGLGLSLAPTLSISRDFGEGKSFFSAGASITGPYTLLFLYPKASVFGTYESKLSQFSVGGDVGLFAPVAGALFGVPALGLAAEVKSFDLSSPLDNGAALLSVMGTF